MEFPLLLCPASLEIDALLAVEEDLKKLQKIPKIIKSKQIELYIIGGNQVLKYFLTSILSMLKKSRNFQLTADVSSLVDSIYRNLIVVLLHFSHFKFFSILNVYMVLDVINLYIKTNADIVADLLSRVEPMIQDICSNEIEPIVSVLIAATKSGNRDLKLYALDTLLCVNFLSSEILHRFDIIGVCKLTFADETLQSKSIELAQSFIQNRYFIQMHLEERFDEFYSLISDLALDKNTSFLRNLSVSYPPKLLVWKNEYDVRIDFLINLIQNCDVLPSVASNKPVNKVIAEAVTSRTAAKLAMWALPEHEKSSVLSVSRTFDYDDEYDDAMDEYSFNPDFDVREHFDKTDGSKVMLEGKKSEDQKIQIHGVPPREDRKIISDAKDQKYKDKNKARFANHNRKQGAMRKLNKSGFAL